MKTQNHPSPRNNNNNNTASSEARLTTVYSTSVPKPKGFSYAHVWSGKPRTHHNEQLSSSSPVDQSSSSPPTSMMAMSPQKRERLMNERREEMGAIRDELAPQMQDILDPALVVKLAALLEEQPRTKKAAQMQRQIIALLRADEKLRESILSYKEEDMNDDRDLQDNEDDEDEDNNNNNSQSAHSSRSGGSRGSSRSVSSSSSSSYSSSSVSSGGTNSDGETAADRKARRHQLRREEKRNRANNRDNRPIEVRQQEKMQQLLREGKHVLQKDLRPRKPDAKKGSKVLLSQDMHRGIRYNHGAPKLHPYRVMSLPWNKARAVKPAPLVEEEEGSKKEDKEKNPKVVVVEDGSLASSEVLDLRYKQARSHRLRVENNERLERREILAHALRGFEDMRYFAKRQKTEIILRHDLDKGEAPSSSRTVSVRQKIYQTLLGEKRPFPAKTKREAPETSVRLCFVNAVHMGDNFMDNFISIEGLTRDVRTIDLSQEDNATNNIDTNNNNKNNTKSKQRLLAPIRQTGMLVDPTLLATELKPCLLAGKIIQGGSNTTNNINNNTSRTATDNDEGIIELNAVMMDSEEADEQNNNNNNEKNENTTGKVLGKALLPASVFTKPSESEVPLLQVDVPIYTLDQKDEVAHCELICDSMKLFNKTGVGYLRQAAASDANANPPNNNTTAASPGSSSRLSSTVNTNANSSPSSSISAPSSGTPSPNRENKNNNNNNDDEVQKFKGPSHVLVECALIDDTPSDASPASRFTPVAAVRSSRHHDRALPLKPANCTPHPSCLMLVQIPRFGSGNGSLNIMRFDIGLFRPDDENNIVDDSSPVSNKSSGSAASARMQQRSATGGGNSSTSGADSSSKEPEVISVDFDLFSIRAKNNSSSNIKQEDANNNNNESNNNNNNNTGGELASAVDVPITENISIRLHFTFVGKEIEFEVPSGDVSSSVVRGQNYAGGGRGGGGGGDTTEATLSQRSGGAGGDGNNSLVGAPMPRRRDSQVEDDLLADGAHNKSGGPVMGLTQEEHDLYYGEHRSLSETMEEDKEKKTAVAQFLHQQQQHVAPHPAQQKKMQDGEY